MNNSVGVRGGERGGSLAGNADGAVNRKFASPDHPVDAYDEVALIPPVAGG